MAGKDYTTHSICRYLSLKRPSRGRGQKNDGIILRLLKGGSKTETPPNCHRGEKKRTNNKKINAFFRCEREQMGLNHGRNIPTPRGGVKRSRNPDRTESRGCTRLPGAAPKGSADKGKRGLPKKGAEPGRRRRREGRIQKL